MFFIPDEKDIFAMLFNLIYGLSTPIAGNADIYGIVGKCARFELYAFR